MPAPTARARRARLLASLLVLAALGVASYLWLTRKPAANSGRRTSPPALELTTIDGARWTLAALRGKVVLIDFWATWCGPCRDEIPKLVELQRSRAARGLQLLGISMDDDPATVQTFYRELKLNYPVAMGDVALAERFGGVLGLPAKFMIDRHGRMVGRSQARDIAELARELDALMQE
jgi:cytochrome c biogenesis protein CcmG, thiol:disulfide interchange protein DsbE